MASSAGAMCWRAVRFILSIVAAFLATDLQGDSTSPGYNAAANLDAPRCADAAWIAIRQHLVNLSIFQLTPCSRAVRHTGTRTGKTDRASVPNTAERLFH